MLKPRFIANYLCDILNFESPRYLLLKRSSNVYLPHIWQIVTGKVKEDESAAQAAYRETFEETGFNAYTCYNVDVTLFYDQSKQNVALSANFCSLIDSKKTSCLIGPEHDAFEFASYEIAKERLAFPSQKQTLDLIHEHFILKEPDKANLIIL